MYPALRLPTRSSLLFSNFTAHLIPLRTIPTSFKPHPSQNPRFSPRSSTIWCAPAYLLVIPLRRRISLQNMVMLFDVVLIAGKWIGMLSPNRK